MTNWKYLAGALLALTVAASGFLAYNILVLQKPRELRQVTLIMDYIPQGRYALFYHALNKGYYAEQGISLQIISGQGSAFSLTQVDQGKADFGSVEFSTLITGIAKGTKVKSIFITEDRSPVGITTWAKFEIRSPKDLEGHSIGVPPFSATRFLLPVVMKLNGADMSKVKVEFVDPATNYASFIQGKFDVTSAYYDSGYPTLLRQTKEHGLGQLDVHTFADWGVDIIGFSLVARPDFLEKNSDLVSRFLAASLKGAQDAFASPEDAVESLIKLVPALANKRDITREEWSNAMEFMKTAEHYGYAKENRIEKSISIIAEAYNLQRLDPKDIYTGEYLPRA